MAGEFRCEGSALDQRFFDRLARWVLTRIESGIGIRITPANGKIIINATSQPVARGAGGGMSCPWVTELPEIPTEPETTRFVFWAGSDRKNGGTGDNGVWCASTGDSRWYPISRYTDEDGIPDA